MKEQYHLFDLHCHSPFSDAQRDFDTIIQGLIDNGIKIVGFADHINPVALYRNPKRFGKERRFVYNFPAKSLRYRRMYLRYLDKKYKKIRILNGGEIDIYPHGGIALPPGISPDFFDYLLLVKHHTLPKPPYVVALNRTPRVGKWAWRHDPQLRLNEYLWEKGLYRAFERYRPHVFGHPQEGMPKYLPEHKIKRMVLMAKKFDVALELNHFPVDELKVLLEYGHEFGVKFSLGSDFHGFADDIAVQLNHSQEMYELVEKFDLELLDPRIFLKNLE
ncbi:MAG: PHP domain-containing protein [Promethearchaeota archaeon]